MTCVHNLTDVETPELLQRKLVGQAFAVGSALLGPGDSAEVDDHTLERVRSELQNMVAMGMAALGDTPAAYQAAKARMVPPDTLKPTELVAAPAVLEPAAEETKPAPKPKKEK